MTEKKKNKVKELTSFYSCYHTTKYTIRVIRNYSPSMTHLLLLLSNRQSAPVHGCCWGTHGSPFHPNLGGSPKAFFNFCKAITRVKDQQSTSKILYAFGLTEITFAAINST